MSEPSAKRAKKFIRTPSAPELVNCHLATGDRLTIYGAVESVERKPLISLRLKDRSGSVTVTIGAESANYFSRIEIGDIFRGVGLLKIGNILRFVHTDNKMQCDVWCGKDGDYNPKLNTIENTIPYDTKRIDELRALGIAKNHSDHSHAVIEYSNLVYLAQACGQTPPLPPPRIADSVDKLADRCKVHESETLNSLAEIYRKTEGLTNDKFFNIFAQVLSLHACEDGGFVLRIWDGKSVSLLSPLAKYHTLAIKHDIIRYDECEENEKMTLDVIFYGKSWEEKLKNVKRKDIILLANIHINKRALGESVLAMHENADDRRCAIVVPPNHFKAVALKKQCEAKETPLKSSNNRILLSTQAANDLFERFELENRGIGAIIDSQQSVQTWQAPVTASQVLTQNLLLSQDAPAFLLKISQVAQEQVIEPINTDEQEGEFSDNEVESNSSTSLACCAGRESASINRSLSSGNYELLNCKQEESFEYIYKKPSSTISKDSSEKASKRVTFNIPQSQEPQEIKQEPISENSEESFHTGKNARRTNLFTVASQQLISRVIYDDEFSFGVDAGEPNIRETDKEVQSENYIEMREENQLLDNAILLENSERDNIPENISLRKIVKNQKIPKKKLNLAEIVRKRSEKELTWEDEINALFRLQPKEKYTFKRKLYFNIPLWKMLILSNRSNITIKNNTEVENSKELHILVPLYTTNEELIVLAISAVKFRTIYPNIASLSYERCEQETANGNVSQKWMTDIYRDLKAACFTSKKNLLVSVNLYARFVDGLILLVEDINSFE